MAPPAPPKPGNNLYARRLAGVVREAHGESSADTLDASENLGDPTGYIPWRNIAIERAVGSGFPLGRFCEVSGPEDCGKSTLLDQLLGSCQDEGGLSVLADTERTRRKAYMESLGVLPGALVWVRTDTIEGMFERVETLVRRAAHDRNKAWADALARAGYKPGKLPTEVYRVYDPHDTKANRKPVAQWTCVQWSSEARAAVIRFQRDNGIKPSGIRNRETAAKLRPFVIMDDPEKPYSKEELAEILDNWNRGIPDERAQDSEAPVIIGWDSVAGTSAEAELTGTARDVNPAAAAKVIRLNMRRMVQLLDDQSFGWLLVNQEYENIEMGWSPSGRSSGPKKSTYGGGAIRYHSSIRLRLRPGPFIYATSSDRENGIPPIGQEVYVKCFKNKMGGPQREERYGLIFGRGAVDAYTIFADLKDRGLINVAGAWSRFVDPTILPNLGAENVGWQRGWQGFEAHMREIPGFDAVVRDLYMQGRLNTRYTPDDD